MSQQGKFGRVGGRVRFHHVLRKRKHHKSEHTGTKSGDASTPASGEATDGDVPAEDIQNDSLYLCEVGIGTPEQKLYLDFDTSSADLWVRISHPHNKKIANLAAPMSTGLVN